MRPDDSMGRGKKGAGRMMRQRVYTVYRPRVWWRICWADAETRVAVAGVRSEDVRRR